MIVVSFLQSLQSRDHFSRGGGDQHNSLSKAISLENISSISNENRYQLIESETDYMFAHIYCKTQQRLSEISFFCINFLLREISILRKKGKPSINFFIFSAKKTSFYRATFLPSIQLYLSSQRGVIPSGYVDPLAHARQFDVWRT